MLRHTSAAGTAQKTNDAPSVVIFIEAD
jgi:hypothetical protein